MTIEDGLESHAQWKILEQLLAKVEDNDELVFDITHGYRVTPVILSSALHFLRITKSIRLRHIYYAAFETDDKRIIDYADFYNIQDLTEGVARLAEEVDMRKLSTSPKRSDVSRLICLLFVEAHYFKNSNNSPMRYATWKAILWGSRTHSDEHSHREDWQSPKDWTDHPNICCFEK